MSKANTILESICTERFTLKQLKASDASQKYLAWLADSDSVNYISYRQEELSELALYIEQRYQDSDCFFWGIFQGEEHIGNIKYQRIVNKPNVVTMGILIGEKNWRGKGLAKEVLTASMEYLKNHHEIIEVNLGVEKSNIAAIKAYENVGFQQTKNGYFNFPEASIEMIKKLK
ncbi:MAG: GNAT family N-acetyltransferase [Colwelliaceae bacterium]|nr:GNAT family N-acetyltransferase [Colwelliaceae bacterium]